MKCIPSKHLGKVRRFLFVPWNSRWNGWVRDITARLEIGIYEAEDSAERTNQIVRYELSKDKKGLKAFLEDGNYYHIHSDELTPVEKQMRDLLLNNCTQMTKPRYGSNFRDYRR